MDNFIDEGRPDRKTFKTLALCTNTRVNIIYQLSHPIKDYRSFKFFVFLPSSLPVAAILDQHCDLL